MRTQLLTLGLVAMAAAMGATACSKTPAPTTKPAASTPKKAPPAATASAKPAASAKAPEKKADTGPFNVLMISIDSMRADMPWAGYKRDIAPNLTKLYKKSIAYKSGYSISSFTSKSLGGFVGGKYPSQMARTQPFFTKYKDSNKMFCESLKEQGFDCVAGHAHAYLAADWAGMAQGFKKWQLVPDIPIDYNKDPYVTSQKMTPMAIKMLSDKELTKKPFFAWFHYMDPHDVYKQHKESPTFGKKARDRYDSEMFYTDMWVGKLLDWVNKQDWAKKTVIVITADHGEAFGEHKLRRHAFEVYEVLVHVPLFMYVPGQKHREIEQPRSHIDLVPTTMELMGAKPNPELMGKSFKPELFGAKAEPRDVMCDLPEDTYNDRHRSLLHDGWKIIAFGNDVKYELYNLKEDPGEKKNLYRKNKAKAKEMLDLYKKASSKIKDYKIPGGVKRKH